jgi:hypothetical protein
MIGGLTVRCFRNDRPPDGWCPAHAARLVVDGQAGVCGGLWPDRCPAASRTPATSADTDGPCGSHADMATVWPDTGPEPLLPQARPPPSAVSMVGVRPAWPPRPPVRKQERTAADTAGHFRCGRPACHAVQVPDTADGRPRPVSARRMRSATGTGRRGGGRWWDAASADGREPAGRSGGREAGRGHRSSPAG